MIVYPERKPEWFTCETCSERVFEEHNNSCRRCGAVAYLNFAYVMGWTLDEADYVRLGLKQAKNEADSRRK